MPSPDFEKLIQPMETVRQIIWGAFLAATVLYVFVAYVALGQSATSAENLLTNPLTIPFAIMGILTAVASRPLARMLLPDRRLQELLSREPNLEALARDARTGKADPDRLGKLSGLPPREQRLFSTVSAFFIPFVVQLAFNEAVALYGLALAFLSREPMAVWPFAIVAFMFNLTVSPKLDSCFERAASLQL